MENRFEKEYKRIEKALLDISLNARDSTDARWRRWRKDIPRDFIPVLLYCWIIDIYHKKHRSRSGGYLDNESPFRKTLDEMLIDRDSAYIRGLFLHILSLDSPLLKRDQQEYAWQDIFKECLLKEAQKNVTVSCPYQCILFDGIIPFQNLKFTSYGDPDDPANLIIDSSLVVSPTILDSFFIHSTIQTVFSVGQATSAERVREILMDVISKYNVSIYQSGIWLMLSYHTRQDNAEPTVHLFDLDRKKGWRIPSYALASIKPSSYIRFDKDPFFVDVERHEALDTNRVVTSTAFDNCSKKTNSLTDIQYAYYMDASLDNYCRVSGPAIVVVKNTALILGYKDKDIAIPKSALSIIPKYLTGSKHRDCIKILHQHAKNLLDGWGPLFDTLKVQMDYRQKMFWVHYLPQVPIMVEEEKQKENALDTLVAYLQTEYKTKMNQDEMKRAISEACSSVSDWKANVQPALELCNKFGWHKGNRYPTEQWADYFGVNTGTFRNLFSRLKGQEISSVDGKALSDKPQDSDTWSRLSEIMNSLDKNG